MHSNQEKVEHHKVCHQAYEIFVNKEHQCTFEQFI
jgi:hypothetical protein